MFVLVLFNSMIRSAEIGTDFLAGEAFSSGD